MRVSLIQKNALFSIDSLSDELTRQRSPQAVAILLHKLERTYSVAALSTLLVEADVHKYRRLLALAGETRVRLLKHLREHAIERSYFACGSLLDSFFGCVVAQRLDVAREIVGLSPARWLE